MNDTNSTAPGDFIRDIVRQDLSKNKNGGRVQTRFPPEPNGYLHIGHARAIWINFSIAAEFGGKCNLRFDDTNPVKEEQEYIDAIQRDIHWLGYDWEDRLYYASSYFEQIEVFRHRAAPARAGFTRLGQGATIFPDLLRGQIINIGFASLDKL